MRRGVLTLCSLLFPSLFYLLSTASRSTYSRFSRSYVIRSQSVPASTALPALQRLAYVSRPFVTHSVPLSRISYRSISISIRLARLLSYLASAGPASPFTYFPPPLFLYNLRPLRPTAPFAPFRSVPLSFHPPSPASSASTLTAVRMSSRLSPADRPSPASFVRPTCVSACPSVPTARDYTLYAALTVYRLHIHPALLPAGLVDTKSTASRYFYASSSIVLFVPPSSTLTPGRIVAVFAFPHTLSFFSGPSSSSTIYRR